MVVHIVDIKSMAINHPEDDAPVAVDRHRMEVSQITAQHMQSITIRQNVLILIAGLKFAAAAHMEELIRIQFEVHRLRGVREL